MATYTSQGQSDPEMWGIKTPSLNRLQRDNDKISGLFASFNIPDRIRRPSADGVRDGITSWLRIRRGSIVIPGKMFYEAGRKDPDLLSSSTDMEKLSFIEISLSGEKCLLSKGKVESADFTIGFLKFIDCIPEYNGK
ncbi:hypothetical protein QYM36_002337, partial [Artemia franciscana]